MIPSPPSAAGPRPWWQLLFFGAIVGFVLSLALTEYCMLKMVRPIEAWVEGGTDAPVAAAPVGTDGTFAFVHSEKRREPGLMAMFHTAPVPIRAMVLIGPPESLDKLTRVTLRTSTRTVVAEGARLRADWQRWDGPLPPDTPPGWQARAYQTPWSPRGSRLAILDQAINYEGDAALARHVLVNPLFIAYAIVFAGLLAARAFAANSAGMPAWAQETADPDAGADASPHGWGWLLAGAGVLSAAGVLLEWHHPYYFTQDDNFTQFLPNILYGCESLFAGVFPTWNPHQYLGAPLAEIGTYALTYPGTWLSYAVATYVLGDAYATMEVFCGLHLLLGYGATFWLGRTLGVAAPLAAAFSLCQVLSGFALIGGRSWYYMTPIFLWTPLFLTALLHARGHAPTWRWTVGVGVVIGLFFHAGNVQMWTYALGLGGVFVACSCLNGSMPWRRVAQMLPAGLIGLGIAAVLLVPQLQATRDLERPGGEGWDATEGVLAMFAPYPTPIDAPSLEHRKYADLDHFGAFYYAGSVFTLAWLGSFLVAGVWRGSMSWFFRDPLRVLALVAFLLALGQVARLWTWQSHLPFLHAFKHPVKFLPFFHLFACAAGAVLIQRAIGQSAHPRRWQGFVFVAVAALLTYHAFWSRSAFFVFAERPYPRLPCEMDALGQGGSRPVRIVSLALFRTTADEYVAGLNHHFPTVYGISSIGGYDPIVEQEGRYRSVLTELQGDPLATVRKHGATHLVLHRDAADALDKRDWSPDAWLRLPGWVGTLAAECARGKPVMQTEFVRVYELKESRPIACGANQTFAIRYLPSSVEVDVSSLASDDEVALNFLWRPGIRVYADDVLTPASADDDQHIRVPVPAGTRRLSVRYESPWGTGFLLGGVLIAVAMVLHFACRKCR